MSILLTIFLLVFVGQLVTWIGKTVLLDIVRPMRYARDELLIGTPRHTRGTYASPARHLLHASAR